MSRFRPAIDGVRAPTWLDPVVILGFVVVGGVVPIAKDGDPVDVLLIWVAAFAVALVLLRIPLRFGFVAFIVALLGGLWPAYRLLGETKLGLMAWVAAFAAAVITVGGLFYLSKERAADRARTRGPGRRPVAGEAPRVGVVAKAVPDPATCSSWRRQGLARTGTAVIRDEHRKVLAEFQLGKDDVAELAVPVGHHLDLEITARDDTTPYHVHHRVRVTGDEREPVTCSVGPGQATAADRGAGQDEFLFGVTLLGVALVGDASLRPEEQRSR